MVNLFIEEPIYISLQDFKDSTNLSLTDEDIKKYIVKSQNIIDFYIGSYDEKQNINQKYIFPTINYGVPDDIKKVVVLISEFLYKNKDFDIKEEKRGQNSISYQKKVNKYENLYINEEIYILLKKYIKLDKSKTLFFRT